MNKNTINATIAREAVVSAVLFCLSNGRALTKEELMKRSNVSLGYLNALTRVGVVKTTRGRNAVYSLTDSYSVLSKQVTTIAQRMNETSPVHKANEVRKEANRQNLLEAYKRLQKRYEELDELFSFASAENLRLTKENDALKDKISTVKAALR
jgi:DNA-binding IscR family transcriptional regulator